MVTKQQAIDAGYRAEFHFTGNHPCSKVEGPRGGITTNITVARASGNVKTWKTRPEEFRLPIKHGMYQSGSINDGNADAWHLATECPAKLVRYADIKQRAEWSQAINDAFSSAWDAANVDPKLLSLRAAVAAGYYSEDN